MIYIVEHFESDKTCLIIYKLKITLLWYRLVEGTITELAVSYTISKY